MPDIDGLTLLRLFRANPPTSGTPVIVLSGNDDAETRTRALAEGANTLVTVGGIQSNHARATAAAAAKLGLHCVLILNGVPPIRPSGNLLLAQLLGAQVEYIPSREERADASEDVLTRLREEGRNPHSPRRVDPGWRTGIAAMGAGRAGYGA
jgi:1-aminocyclopropane-1-carboxylate deaminase/D-cysteine desulfhydrase-like pyridoxal-dependent ACC family enzyme